MKIAKPTDKDREWIERLEDRSHSSCDLLMVIDGKKVALRLMRPLTADSFASDAVLDAAQAALITAVR